MIVCGHGDVSEYCEAHDMIVAETYTGDIKEYNGVCPVLVTDADITETEYFFLKGILLSSGKELIHTRYSDTKLMAEYAVLSVEKIRESRKGKSGGKTRFGFQRVGNEIIPIESEMKVVRRIFELRDAGYTYRTIREDKEVRYADGRKLSISLIQTIVSNRESYEV